MVRIAEHVMPRRNLVATRERAGHAWVRERAPVSAVRTFIAAQCGCADRHPVLLPLPWRSLHGDRYWIANEHNEITDQTTIIPQGTIMRLIPQLLYCRGAQCRGTDIPAL